MNLKEQQNVWIKDDLVCDKYYGGVKWVEKMERGCIAKVKEVSKDNIFYIVGCDLPYSVEMIDKERDYGCREFKKNIVGDEWLYKGGKNYIDRYIWDEKEWVLSD